MQFYAISDGSARPGEAADLVQRAVEWARCGVSVVQIREKHLTSDEQVYLTRQICQAVRRVSPSVRVLLNGPASAAARAEADGVHLPANGAASIDVVWQQMPGATVSVACHSVEEVAEAYNRGASMAIFAPVFEKLVPHGRIEGQGVEQLRGACSVAREMPVFALGGVTAGNAHLCVAAGAAGVAGIRLFAGDGWMCLR